MLPVMIRLATPCDIEAIRTLSESAYGRYVARIGRRPAPMDADHGAMIAAGQVWVACDAEGAVTGYVTFWPEVGALYLDSIAVRVPGQGTGGALMAHAEAWAKARGLGSIRLYTNAAMTENLTLYPHLGFVRTGQRMDDGFDRVFFKKDL